MYSRSFRAFTRKISQLRIDHYGSWHEILSGEIEAVLKKGLALFDSILIFSAILMCYFLNYSPPSKFLKATSQMKKPLIFVRLGHELSSK